MLSAGTLTVLPCVADKGRCSKKVDPHEPALPSLLFGLDRGVALKPRHLPVGLYSVSAASAGTGGSTIVVQLFTEGRPMEV